jgi:hypothetical protein
MVELKADTDMGSSKAFGQWWEMRLTCVQNFICLTLIADTGLASGTENN